MIKKKAIKKYDYIKNTAIILACGESKRFKSSNPKQYTQLFGEAILNHTIKIFLKNKAKTLEDIYNNSKYIILDEVNFNTDDLKLIDEKAKKIISDFNIEISKLEKINKNILEPIINDLIKNHETNFKGVGQPLRIALTGSKFGPGIYDIMISLGKIDIEKRLRKII